MHAESDKHDADTTPDEAAVEEVLDEGRVGDERRVPDTDGASCAQFCASCS